MKFNAIKKEVDIYDRILCFLLAAAITSAFILGSFSRPITAHALGEADTIASDIRSFYNDTKRELDRVERAIATDMNNGNLDASSELYSEYMTALALQYAMVSSPNFSTLVSLANSYNDGAAEAQKFLDYLNNNPTTTFSGSGSSGIYRSALDGKIHSVTLLPGLPSGEYRNFTATCATSDEFNYTITYTQEATWNRNVVVTDSYARDGWSTVRWNNVWMWGDISVVADNYWYGYNGTIDDNSQGMSPCVLYSSSLPDNWTLDRSMNYNPITTPKHMGYNCVDVSLPSASVDTETPWNYYNDTLLPYMHENYPEVTNNYYIFPNGYTPAPSPVDPTEPPLFPYTQPWQNDFIYPQTETSVSIINPTATNDSGTTYTETTIVTVPATETSSSYVPVYGFNVPLLPNLETVTATLPAETIPPQTAQKITDLWAFVKWILDESGMFPIFLALVSIGFVMFIIRFIGG